MVRRNGRNGFRFSGTRVAQTLYLSKSAAPNLINVYFLLISQFAEGGVGHPPRRFEKLESLNVRDSALASVAALGAQGCPN